MEDTPSFALHAADTPLHLDRQTLIRTQFFLSLEVFVCFRYYPLLLSFAYVVLNS